MLQFTPCYYMSRSPLFNKKLVTTLHTEPVLVDQLNLFQFTLARRINNLLEDIELSLKQKISKCLAFSIALDENTEISDTKQLVFQLSYLYFNVTCKLIENFFSQYKK